MGEKLSNLARLLPKLNQYHLGQIKENLDLVDKPSLTTVATIIFSQTIRDKMDEAVHDNDLIRSLAWQLANAAKLVKKNWAEQDWLDNRKSFHKRPHYSLAVTDDILEAFKKFLDPENQQFKIVAKFGISLQSIDQTKQLIHTIFPQEKRVKSPTTSV